jgi:hypothetical protein
MHIYDKYILRGRSLVGKKSWLWSRVGLQAARAPASRVHARERALSGEQTYTADGGQSERVKCDRIE